MADNFQTTFIPKASGKEITSVINAPMKSGYTLERVLALVTLLIFVGTCLAYGFLWYKKLSIQNTKAEIEQTLQEVKSSLEDGEIDTISELNNRLIVSNKLYSEHLSPVQIFPILEAYTLKSATLNNFLYEYLEDGTVHINANGAAANYKSIVRLTDTYEKSEKMSRILVSNLAKTTDGTVTFSLDAFIDPDLIKYKNIDFSKSEIIDNDFEPDLDPLLNNEE